MKDISVIAFVHFIIIFGSSVLNAQDSAGSCKVLALNLSVNYKGDCKNGLANGQGDASGIHHYKGSFKDGIPDGYGTYYYDDSTYYMGYFQDGIKEGRGEAHYMHQGKPDSTIKGYWSGNEYRGKKYITYDFDGATKFDRYEITATPEWGHTISFEISTGTGSPAGFANNLHNAGYVLKLDELNVGNNTIIRKLSEVITPTRTFYTYDINVFPVVLYATLSNGDSFKLHLYKNARWTARLFVDK
jgi:hypothetical protein